LIARITLRGEEGPARYRVPDPVSGPPPPPPCPIRDADPNVVFLTDLGSVPAYTKASIAPSVMTYYSQSGIPTKFVTKDDTTIPRNVVRPRFRLPRRVGPEYPFMLWCDTQAVAPTHQRGLRRLPRPLLLDPLMHRATACSRNAQFYEQEASRKARSCGR
jgi:hypothetical protein